MLGDLIANLDNPDVAAAVLATMDPIVATRIERRAAAATRCSPPMQRNKSPTGRGATAGQLAVSLATGSGQRN